MQKTNQVLKSLAEAEILKKHYDVPITDIISLALNLEGISYNKTDNPRIRFEMKQHNSKQPLFHAITNTTSSRWTHINNKVSFLGEEIGIANTPEEDVCDSTYFRKFEKIKGKILGTEITINSNSRSACKGCEFCGTYNLNPKDADGKDLTTKEKIRKKINQTLKEEKISNFKHITGIGVVTGCFPDENKTLEHLLMLNNVFREEYKFKGSLKYLGAQIRSEESLRILFEEANPFNIYFTVECFERRNNLLKKSKQIQLSEIKNILNKAKKIGIDTSILYIAGLDSLSVFEREMKEFKPLLTTFPIINTMQEYVPAQGLLKHPEANNIEYFLKKRKIVEKIFSETTLKPRVWENYRGLFFTKYNGCEINDTKI
ncbi:MAG: hypothetical protein ABIC91_06875 [Nanoarchaeota archaeon]|nr:hypothetical protein [Nanoarchaeota archaeon]MBU1029712.1 hypothetical protein [Nanoarchaeota archaeon]MBU1850117.1 hypothetical protein [Nanoarchaeota archaeon]